jgi:hypothetical protein
VVEIIFAKIRDQLVQLGLEICECLRLLICGVSANRLKVFQIESFNEGVLFIPAMLNIEKYGQNGKGFVV